MRGRSATLRAALVTECSAIEEPGASMAGEGSESTAVDVLLVRVGTLRCGLVLDTVVEVLPVVEISALPRSPQLIEGVIDVRGTLVPVLSLRKRLGLPPRPLDLDDHVVLCRVSHRVVGVLVDRADDVAVIDRADVALPTDVAVADFLAGVTRLRDGLMLIYDVRSFLAADEVLHLDEALAAVTAGRR